jgi:hypothetical protein
MATRGNWYKIAQDAGIKFAINRAAEGASRHACRVFFAFCLKAIQVVLPGVLIALQGPSRRGIRPR